MNLFKFIRRQMVPLVVICCVVFLGAQSALAQQTISYPNFNSTTGLRLNGNAAMVNNGTANVLRLTPTATNQVGSAWYATTFPLSQGFSTTFTFQLSGSNNAADGIAFVVQNGSFPNGTSGTSAVYLAPIGGGSIGLTGLTHSLAIEFDIFCNGSDICVSNSFSSANEVGILSCGANANSYNHNAPPAGCGVPGTSHVSPASPILANGAVHTAVINYTPPCTGCNNLTVTLDNNPILAVAFDLAILGLDASDDAFVGFTGATGALFENQDILSWTFTDPQGQLTTPQQPITQGQVNDVTFVDPGVMDQRVQIAADANLGGAAFMSVTFMQIAQNVFDSTRLTGTPPNTWSGGAPVPAGTKCTIIQGTGNCVVAENLCFGPDPTRTPIKPCNIAAGPTALIQLTSHYKTSTGQANPGLIIATDGQNDWANITDFFSCTGSGCISPGGDPTNTIGGGSKILNSDEAIVDLPTFGVCLLYDPTKAAKSGSTLPLKMYLCDSTGKDVSGADLIVHATVLQIVSSTTTDTTVVDAGNANPDNDFRFDPTLGPSGGYIFNLKTTGLSGTYNLQFTVGGVGTTVYSLPFQVK